MPLLMVGFGIIIPFPFNAIPAIIVRWVLHVLVHALIPGLTRGGEGLPALGSLKFIALGLVLSDIKNSLAFIVSGNIIAPVMLHHLDVYVVEWAGNKERIAKSLGIQITP